MGIKYRIRVNFIIVMRIDIEQKSLEECSLIFISNLVNLGGLSSYPEIFLIEISENFMFRLRISFSFFFFFNYINGRVPGKKRR